MASDDTKDKWGTIFIDATRESTMSKLDAMQAASRQEQWNQRTQNDYLEKVREKAIERARTILGEAYTERQKILEEAQQDADRIREEAQTALVSAEGLHNQAQGLRHDAQAERDNAVHIRNTAQEEGFQAGLEQAKQALEDFRATMGSALAGVLHTMEGQCLNIFAGWREELVSLLKLCVEKGTGLMLDEKHSAVLEHAVIEAVRQLDQRHAVILHAHPDDAATIADIFASAKETLPDLRPWTITADPNVTPGGLVAESPSGTVDSQRELFGQMIENILSHLMLPETALDADALQQVHAMVEEKIQRINELVPQTTHEAQAFAESAPPLEEENMSPPLAQEEPLEENTSPASLQETHEEIPPSAPEENNGEEKIEEEETAVQQSITEHADETIQQEDSELFDESTMHLTEILDDSSTVDVLLGPTPVAAYQEPTREELEEELLPVPLDDEENFLPADLPDMLLPDEEASVVTPDSTLDEDNITPSNVVHFSSNAKDKG